MTTNDNPSFPSEGSCRNLPLNRPVRWALIDGWSLFRTAVERLLRLDTSLEWIGSFGSGKDALNLLPALEPEVIVMDIELPDIDGIECVSRLKSLCPGMKILILTTHDHPEAMLAAFRAGASGYLVKSTVGPSRIRLRDAILDLHGADFPYRVP